jgi:hypothetical protein
MGGFMHGQFYAILVLGMVSSIGHGRLYGMFSSKLGLF